jgi:O-antigen ligase
VNRIFGLLAVLLILLADFPVRIRQGFLVFGSFSLLDILLVAAPFLFLLIVLWTNGKVFIGDNILFGIVLLPLVLAIVSALWSRNLNQTFYYVVNTTLAVAAYLLTVNLLHGKSSSSVARLMALFVIVAVATAFLSFLRVPGFAPSTYSMEAGGTEELAFLASYYSRLSHPFWRLSNNLAGVLAFFPIIFIGFAVDTRRRSYLYLAIVALVCILMTLSRGVAIALFGGFGIYAVMARRAFGKTAFVLGAAVVAVTIAVFAAYQYNDYVGEYLSTRLNLVNIDARVTKFDAALEKIEEQPLAGYGAGVVPDDEPELIGGSHNTYLESMMHFGIPVGTLFNLSFVLLAFPFFRAQHELRPSLVPAALVASVLAQVLVFSNQASYEGALQRILFYMSLGLGIALVNSMRRERAQAPAAAI